MLATGALNRRRSIVSRGPERRSIEAFFYILIRVWGAAICLAIVGACLLNWPQLRDLP